MAYLVILALILLNGLFAMSEMALISSRRARLQKLVDSGDTRAAAALALNAEPTRFLSTIQIGITSVGILSGLLGESIFAEPLAEVLATWGMEIELAQLLASGLVVIGLTFFSIVIGELLPKRIAQIHPEGIARLVASPVSLIATLARPLVTILSVSTDLLLRLMGIQRGHEPTVTEDEINALLAEGSSAGVIEEQEHQMVRNVFRLDDRKIGSFMVPRTEMLSLQADAEFEVNLRILAESDRSRFPVVKGECNEVVGVVSARRLLNQYIAGEKPDIERAMLPAVFVPETLTGMEMLETFRSSSAEMVVVVDEYGQTQGIVTLQDIFEAITGAFTNDGADDAWAVQREDKSWLIDGLIPVHELKDLLELDTVPEEEKGRYNTLAGMLILLLGRLPAQTDRVCWERWCFEIVDLDGRRIDKVLASRQP